jgi:predicted CXXCH cytochrome family protein
MKGYMRTRTKVAAGAALALVVAAGAGYRYISTGGLIARQTPGAMETRLAGWVVKASVPAAAKAMRNPLSGEPGTHSVTGGRDLYKDHCEGCHAYDGSGHSELGSGVYPPPSDLRAPAIQKASDGELFYFIRNGIRNTAMPGFRLADHAIWQLVLFLRHLPKVAAHVERGSDAGRSSNGQYAGSASCKSCHEGIYQRWQKTRMANVVVDPREHSEAIIPDFSKPDPLLTFGKDQIAFVYGSKWKQRYFTKKGGDYYPLPAQWDVTNKVWRAYKVKPGTDWWTSYYPDDNMERPTGPTCDGCHSVNYNVATKQVTEWNVGCEKCHGPGAEHAKNPTAANIIDPARLNYVDANNTCFQCHTQGQPLMKASAGKAYDWPVGFEMGKKLDDYWKLEERKLGETTFTHFADGTAHKNRMQGNDFVNNAMYTHGITCFTCHDAHGTEHDALLRKPSSELCLDCHGPKSPNGPRGASLQEHTHHKEGATGSDCLACHMPKIEQTIADVNVRSHTFRFVTPAETGALKVPNACNVCHKDRSTQWAAEGLKAWGQFSPWRMQR